MKNKIPRQGARWDDDDQGSISTLYEEYGATNVHHARKIKDKILLDYPHLDLLKGKEEEVLADLLDSALRSTRNAASKGRTHTMPETLDLLGEILGKEIAAGNITSLQFVITYGDEPATSRKLISFPALALFGALTLCFFFLTLLLPFRWGMLGNNGQLITSVVGASIVVFLLKTHGRRISFSSLLTVIRPYKLLVAGFVIILTISDMLQQAFNWPVGLEVFIFFLLAAASVWAVNRIRRNLPWIPFASK